MSRAGNLWLRPVFVRLIELNSQSDNPKRNTESAAYWPTYRLLGMNLVNFSAFVLLRVITNDPKHLFYGFPIYRKQRVVATYRQKMGEPQLGVGCSYACTSRVDSRNQPD